MKKNFPQPIVVLAALCAFAHVSPAQTYYLYNNQTGNWNDAATWFDAPSGGTALVTMNSAGSYVSQTFSVRAGTGTFAGSSLTLSSGGTINARGTGAGSIVANFSATGGQITAGVGTAVFAPTNFTLSNNILANVGTSILTLNVGTLTGSGNLSISGSTGQLLLNTTNASAYTGNIVWGNANNTVLNFNNDFASGGGLTALATSRIALDQNVSFANVTLNGTPLAAGTYSYATLNSNYDSIFTDGGSGSITVVPEPSVCVLVTLGCATLLTSFRRRHCCGI